MIAKTLLRKPEIPLLAAIVGTVALCWLYLIPASLDMYGSMDGLSAWMMRASWDLRYALLIFLMWAVMMTGMMLPSAAPVILLYNAIVKNRPHPQQPVIRSHTFAGGYLLAWLGFSVLATLAQWQLATAALLSPMMESRSPLLGAALLITAGAYQWTPFKRACLHQCRSPADFLSRHWRPGVGGALRMGIAHGLYCLGCCWALMLLLFFGGVMNLLWIAGIALFVLLEKLAPVGEAGGRIAGLVLVTIGAWLLLTAI